MIDTEFNHVSNAASDDARLARTRTRQHQQWSIDVRNSRLLAWSQLLLLRIIHAFNHANSGFSSVRLPVTKRWRNHDESEQS